MLSNGRLATASGYCGSSNSRNMMFAPLMLAFITLANFTPCSASPLHMTQSSALTTRATTWRPSAGTSWNYQLTGTIDPASTNVDVWDIDLFDATPSTISTLHAAGKYVICYFSAGSIEDWRPDGPKFQPSDKGSPVQSWKGENWLQTKSSNVRTIMLARLDLAAQKKCDGVEPDNVDAYDNGNGLSLTENDAVDYVTFLAEAAHSRGMAVGLKNAGSIAPRLVSKVEFSVQEECVQYGNCAEFQPFIDQNKPVFHVEYSNGMVAKREAWMNDFSSDDASNQDDSTSSSASSNIIVSPLSSKADAAASGSSGCAANVAGFSSIMKNLDLGTWVQICP